MDELTMLGLMLLVALVWYHQMRARETSLALARQACLALEVMLLDDTVALISMGLGRDPEGRWRIRRTYGFEFADQSMERQRGTVILLGDRQEGVYIHGEQRAMGDSGRRKKPRFYR